MSNNEIHPEYLSLDTMKFLLENNVAIVFDMSEDDKVSIYLEKRLPQKVTVE